MNWRMRIAQWLLRGTPLREILDLSRVDSCAVIEDGGDGKPILFADPQVFDFEMAPSLPFTVIPARQRPGMSLRDSFFVVRIPEHDCIGNNAIIDREQLLYGLKQMDIRT